MATQTQIFGGYVFHLQANSLHWGCLTALPHVYNTPLWQCICDTLDIIAEGVRVSATKCIYNMNMLK